MRRRSGRARQSARWRYQACIVPTIPGPYATSMLTSPGSSYANLMLTSPRPLVITAWQAALDAAKAHEQRASAAGSKLYMHTLMHTYIHAYIYACIHTYVQRCECSRLEARRGFGGTRL